jgi:hypothetical protein
VWRTEATVQRHDADPRIALIVARYPSLARELEGKPSAFVDGVWRGMYPERADRNDSASVIPNGMARRARILKACPGLNLQGQSEDFVDGAAATLVALGKMTKEAATPRADGRTGTHEKNWRHKPFTPPVCPVQKIDATPASPVAAPVSKSASTATKNWRFK